jgi:hypothetical protein
MNLFPQEDLSPTEKNLLAEALQNPVVQKYLLLRARNIASAIVEATPDAEESTEAWLRKEIYLKGQINVLEDLYSIKPVQ